jgi:hypothetical protein
LKANEFQRDDLLETNKIMFAIKTMSGAGVIAGLQESNAIVVMQRAYRYSRQSRELVRLIHVFPVFFHRCSS